MQQNCTPFRLEKSDPLMVLWPAILQEIERVLSLQYTVPLIGQHAAFQSAFSRVISDHIPVLFSNSGQPRSRLPPVSRE